jgi:D-sedoheptulose 7-phosphate isomerase
VENLVTEAFGDLEAALRAAEPQKRLLVAAGSMIASSLARGGAVLLCGNGGSASQAQHLAAEFVGRFLVERPGLPALALTADTSKLTAIGNDYGFENVFARQTAAMGRPGDVLWALSTSGTSPNVLAALAMARERGLGTLFFCGNTAAPEEIADLVVAAPGGATPRIQELHLLYGHVICQLVDGILFGGGAGALR